jgi:hypothetical protein
MTKLTWDSLCMCTTTLRLLGHVCLALIYPSVCLCVVHNSIQKRGLISLISNITLARRYGLGIRYVYLSTKPL